MAHGTTVKVVESAVRALNDKVKLLGWSRRYEFEKGSGTMGVQHVLLTYLPHPGQPIGRQPIGNTLNKAHRYLEAMGQVLNDALLERASARAGVMTGLATTGEHRLVRDDPDARSKRPGEAI